MAHRFVPTDEFQPNNGDWTTIGKVVSFAQNGNTLRLESENSGVALEESFLGARCFRVRFRPVANPVYVDKPETDYAVVQRNLSPVTLTVTDGGDHLSASTGSISVRIDRNPFRIRVFRGAQLICADEPVYNLVYIPNAAVVANFKTYPANAHYCGFGEKAGSTLFKNQTTMTFFNFDNFGIGQLGRAGTSPPPACVVTVPCPSGELRPNREGLYHEQLYLRGRQELHAQLDGELDAGRQHRLCLPCR